jgi:xanthine dehydrogenase small subunit
VLASSRGEREVRLADYFTGYRQSVKRPDELIKTIRIPLPVAPVTAFHKIAKRRFDDISGVAIAYAMRLSPDRSVESIFIGLGGVAATPIRALAAERALAGRPWTREVVAAAAEEMARGRHADERPPRQPGLPDRDAAQLAAEVLCRNDGRGQP